jgi:hypothetical protein
MSKARFHFEIFWPKFEEYDQTILDAWQRLAGSTGAIRHLDDKLRGSGVGTAMLVCHQDWPDQGAVTYG